MPENDRSGRREALRKEEPPSLLNTMQLTTPVSNGMVAQEKRDLMDGFLL
jgi:hypothetical protein